MSVQKDQSQPLGNNGFGLRYNTTQTQLGTAFIPSISARRPSVNLQLGKTGAPSGNVWVQLREDLAGLPGALITETNPIACSAVITGVNPFYYPTPPFLEAGVRYHICLVGDYTISTTNYISADNYYIPGNNYSPFAQELGNSVDVWSEFTTAKMMFWDYYETTARGFAKKIAGVLPKNGISVDATSSKGNGVTVSNTLTWAHTISEGSDRVLVVYLPISQAIYPSTIKFNGVDLTYVVAMDNGVKAYIYRLLDPPVGTYNIEVVFNTSIAYLYAGAASFFGVDQDTPFINMTTAYGTAQNKTFTQICTYDNSYILECMGEGGSVQTPLSGQTLITTDNRISAYDSGIVVGNNSQSYSTPTSMAYCWVGCEMKAAKKHWKKVAGVLGANIKKIINKMEYV